MSVSEEILTVRKRPQSPIIHVPIIVNGIQIIDNIIPSIELEIEDKDLPQSPKNIRLASPFKSEIEQDEVVIPVVSKKSHTPIPSTTLPQTIEVPTSKNISPPSLSSVRFNPYAHVSNHFSNLSSDEVTLQRQGYIVNIGTLRNNYPQLNNVLAKEVGNESLLELYMRYEKLKIFIYSETNASYYMMFMYAGFMLLEIICVNYFEILVAKGFAEKQCNRVKNYKDLLLEMGQVNSLAQTASKWPVELRLIGLMLFEFVIFCVLNYFSTKKGTNVSYESTIDGIYKAFESMRPDMKNVETGQAQQNANPMSGLMGMATNLIGNFMGGKSNDAETVQQTRKRIRPQIDPTMIL